MLWQSPHLRLLPANALSALCFLALSTSGMELCMLPAHGRMSRTISLLCFYTSCHYFSFDQVLVNIKVSGVNPSDSATSTARRPLAAPSSCARKSTLAVHRSKQV